MLLHNGQELDDDLRRRTDENLALARLLGVVDGVERIVEDGGLDHFGVMRRFSMAEGDQGIWVVTVSLQMPKLKECPQSAT